ncbi:uncharacterized protein LOC110246524 isoform X2 [Exaiptasia diaphana]|uniref:Uncharacterized protein n=1 Tax=Exaiptasia diaphana TaxID=2652724 RepID=A0A913YQ02_EXADI|nr:uncharacterized protein LOC110246524 isoform X2 [Exaiptasia diaphana]
MATTITIHHGEILLIQRMIQNTKDARKLRGALYGLYTQSGQPVVQLICGSKEKKNLSKCQKYLESEHGLLLLGRWTIAASDADAMLIYVAFYLFIKYRPRMLESIWCLISKGSCTLHLMPIAMELILKSFKVMER